MSSHAQAKGTTRVVAVARASTGLTTHRPGRRKGASQVPGLARPARWSRAGNPCASRMIPLESPVPEIGPPVSESGGRKRTHGSRPAARSESGRKSHRPPTGPRGPPGPRSCLRAFATSTLTSSTSSCPAVSAETDRRSRPGVRHAVYRTGGEFQPFFGRGGPPFTPLTSVRSGATEPARRRPSPRRAPQRRTPAAPAQGPRLACRAEPASLSACRPP